MRKRTKIALIIIIALVAISAVFLAIYKYSMEKANTEKMEAVTANELHVGDVAPDFTVKLLSGDEFTLSDNEGKTVFLNFWATWCSPCVAEMPAIQELSEKYIESTVFISISCGEKEREVQSFIDRSGFTYNIGLDESGEMIKSLYPSIGIPFTLVIDAGGIITAIFIGGGDQMHDVFENAILEAQKGISE